MLQLAQENQGRLEALSVLTSCTWRNSKHEHSLTIRLPARLVLRPLSRVLLQAGDIRSTATLQDTRGHSHRKKAGTQNLLVYGSCSQQDSFRSSSGLCEADIIVMGQALPSTVSGPLCVLARSVHRTSVALDQSGYL